MYNFYQYERQNRRRHPATDLVTPTSLKPTQTVQVERPRARSNLGTESLDSQQASIEMRRKSEGTVKPRSPTQKRERLVESYKSRVASFIKDVSIALSVT